MENVANLDSLKNHKAQEFFKECDFQEKMDTAMVWQSWGENIKIGIWIIVSILVTYFTYPALSWWILPYFIGVVIVVGVINSQLYELGNYVLHAQYGFVPGFWKRRKKLINTIKDFNSLMDNKEKQVLILDFFKTYFKVNEDTKKRYELKQLKLFFEEENKTFSDMKIMFTHVGHLYTEYLYYEQDMQEEKEV